MTETPPTPSRSATDDIELKLPRRLRGSALAALVTLAAGAAAAHFALAAKVDAAAQAAASAPAEVLRVVEPRLTGLEGDRDAATAERRLVADEIGAVRLYLCRECERTRRALKACDDICRR